MAKVYNIISITAFCLAAAGLTLSIVFWFKFKIPKIMSELSGKAVRKSASVQSGQKRMANSVYKPKSVEVRKGDIEDKTESNSDSIKQNRQTKEFGFFSTDSHETGTKNLRRNIGTVDLNHNREGGTRELQKGGGILSGTADMSRGDFKIIQSIVLIHTDEVI